MREIASDSSVWPSIVLIGPLVWTFNVASIVVLVHTSTVVHSMIRSMRRPLLVLASIITFGTHITRLNALGIMFTLLGAFWYRLEREELNGKAKELRPSEIRPSGHRDLLDVLQAEWHPLKPARGSEKASRSVFAPAQGLKTCV